MSHAQRTSPTERIKGPTWDDGEYAVVRTFLSGIARRSINDAAMRVNPQTNEVHVDTAAGALAKLKAGLLELHVTYADGGEIPFTDEGLQDLPEGYVDYILTKLTELWAAWDTPKKAPATEEEALEVDFRGNAAPLQSAARSGKRGGPATRPSGRDEAVALP